jgi:hypothetical protein
MAVDPGIVVQACPKSGDSSQNILSKLFNTQVGKLRQENSSLRELQAND